MTATNVQQRSRRWRNAAWSIAAALLLTPLIAMQFTPEVNWSPGDFLVFGGMLAAVGIALELAANRTPDPGYRAAVAVALLGAFLLIWICGAVGIIGSADEPANLLFGVVLLIGVGGAVLTRAQAEGMGRVLLAMALAQFLIGGLAVVSGRGAESARWPWDILLLTAILTGLWLVSSALFRKSATA